MSGSDQPRYVVEKHGPASYYVFDKATGLSRHPSFTRRGARKIADEKNAPRSTKESR